MSEVGRELQRDIGRIADALESSAKAANDLNELAKAETLEEQQMISPGFCPHCATVNPTIRNEGGSDKMNSFVLVAFCNNCGKIFYGVPNGWQVFAAPEAAQELLMERTQ